MRELANRVDKLDKATSHASVSSKTGANTSVNKASRPDLVAHSTSSQSAASQIVGHKTRPLLINHHHHVTQSNKDKRVACMIDVVGKASTSARSLATTTLTPQIILSAIPAQTLNTTLNASGVGLNGFQICLSTSTQSPIATSSTKIPTSASVTTLISGSSTSSHSQAPRTTTSMNSRTNTSKTSMVHPRIVTAKPSSARNESKAKSKSDVAQTTVKVEPQDHSEQAISPTGSNGNNATAARLLDLGKRLLEATKEGNIEQVKHLVVESGAPFTTDWLGTTALHIAAQNGNHEIAEILLLGGINRDAKTKLERTALHMAAQSGYLDIVDLLITSGAEVNARDMLKMTPLHWAVERGHAYVAERLLMAGADLTLKSKFLLSPFDIARNSYNTDMVDLFRTWTGEQKSANEYNENIDNDLNHESQDFLDIDYQLALVESAASSHLDTVLENEKPCIDLVEMEWNKFEFEPDFFLADDSDDDEPKVGYLMKVVEELQKENKQLRQRVEQLSTPDP